MPLDPDVDGPTHIRQTYNQPTGVHRGRAKGHDERRGDGGEKRPQEGGRKIVGSSMLPIFFSLSASLRVKNFPLLSLSREGESLIR